VLVVLAVVVFVVTGPLRRAPDRRLEDAGTSAAQAAAQDSDRRLAELEASREAKYREIRDADLDHRTGKLSDADFEALDQTLRAEAVEILHELDRVRDERSEAEAPPPG